MRIYLLDVFLNMSGESGGVVTLLLLFLSELAHPNFFFYYEAAGSLKTSFN